MKYCHFCARCRIDGFRLCNNAFHAFCESSSVCRILVCISRVCLRKCITNHVCLLHPIGRIQPDMCIYFFFAIFFPFMGMTMIVACQCHRTSRCIYNKQVGILPHNLIHKAFHAQTVDEQHICTFQCFHIFCCQFVVVEAACLRLCHILQSHAFHTICHICRQQINRIKAGHNSQTVCLCCFSRCIFSSFAAAA